MPSVCILPAVQAGEAFDLLVETGGTTLPHCGPCTTAHALLLSICERFLAAPVMMPQEIPRRRLLRRSAVATSHADFVYARNATGRPTNWG